jgi:Ni/Co efflux regulator RcnB
MLTRRLTLAVIATAFAASSSLAMLQNARPAAADPDDHWRHNAHHQRIDRDDHRRFDRDDHRRHHDRDDRRWRGNGNGWNNPQNPHYASYRWNGKPHVDPWRDGRRR